MCQRPAREAKKLFFLSFVIFYTMTVSWLLLLDLYSHVYVSILFIVRRHGKDIIPAF
jgi:hypothetical protein